MNSSVRTIIDGKDDVSQEKESTLALELEKLMVKHSSEKNGFQKLFAKFISQEGKENVVWEDIEKPAQDSVSK